jgi:hypothetical protein
MLTGAPRRIPETPAEWSLAQALDELAELMSRCGHPREWVYDSPLDFLQQHGQWFTPVPRPPHVRLGAPKHCFGNAIIAADRYGLMYVEGYALLDLGAGGIPLEHAWCCTTDGALVEVTTPEPWGAYFGMGFSTGRADDCTWYGDANVLNDYRRHHPLLGQRWTGEDWSKVWPVSPARAQALRKEEPHG